MPREIERAVRAAEDKKAVDLVALDLRKAAGFTDYFLLCTGNNPRQVRAIADGVWRRWRRTASSPRTLRARSADDLLDYFDFIVHIFAPERGLLRSERSGQRGQPRRIALAACRSGVRRTADSLLSIVLAPDCASRRSARTSHSRSVCDVSLAHPPDHPPWRPLRRSAGHVELRPVCCCGLLDLP
jgi:ribosome-associated protein